MSRENITIENARIIFRNFSGEEGQYNPKGRRNFCVLLDDSMARALEEDGWNVRYLKPRDEDDIEQAYLQVTVSYNNYPPKAFVISSKGKTLLDEDTINILDWAEIDSVDIIISPYNWEVNGKAGVKAYLKSIWVTIIEDELEKKYRDVPDSAASGMMGHD